MKNLIVIFLIFSSLVYADDGVIYLDKDKPAPFSGFLFSPEKEQIARFALKELDYYKALNESREKVIVLYKTNETLYTERLEQYRKQNDTLSQDLFSARQTTSWEKFFYLATGVLITGVAFVTAKKLAQ